jgi:hypothetical protein
MTHSLVGVVSSLILELRHCIAEGVNGGATAGRIATASAKQIGRFNMSIVKGLVDIPFACAEGFNAVPTLYGEKVRDHGNVKDWSSGFAVAGKNFAYGVTDGVTGLWMQPYANGKAEGSIGVAKGIGKGVLGLGSKLASAGIGLVGYSGQGISKSIRHAAKSRMRRKIAAAKLAESAYLGELHATEEEVLNVVNAFKLFQQRETA